MIYSTVIRLISGFIFAFLAHRFLGLSGFLWLLIVVLALLAGIFIFPLLTLAIRDWAKKLAGFIAAEVMSQIRVPGRILRHPKPVSKENKYLNPVVLDTSVIIDGRLLDIIRTGFFWATLLVPKFVLTELQTIADSKDDLKRARGRRGLEILEELKKSKSILLKVSNTEVSGKEVDEKILKLAKKLRAKVLTVDYNLNKVGQVRGIAILNINELANSVKTVVLPGEEIQIKIIQEGKEKNQGVGYLEDGTMVVVEEGLGFLGHTIKVVISRILQTAAGKMVFCKVKE